MSQEHIHRWNRSDLVNPHQHPNKEHRVRAMFSGIAHCYDLLNHLLSFNMDKRWRAEAAKLADLQPGQTVLDLCCGTGDLTFAFARNQPQLDHILAVDFCPEMIEIAENKAQKLHQRANIKKNIQRSAQQSVPQITWKCDDALQLDLPFQSFDRIGCAFGIRNLTDQKRFFELGYKLLKDHGRIVILEFGLPQNAALRWAYLFYFKLALPVIGSIISSDRTGAYNYLPASVNSFDTRSTLDLAAKQAGFVECSWHSLAGGTVLALVAKK